LLVLATTFFVFVELTLNAFLSRASIKFVGEADDWAAVGATVLRLHLLVGIVGGLLLGLPAIPLARIFGEPELAFCLVLCALHVPFASLSQGHQSILIGTGKFRQRALANAARWLARLALILVLVEAGLSVPGAILGSLGASVVELVVSRRFVKLPLFGHIAVRVRPFLEIGIVLGAFSLLNQVFSNMGVVLLKMLGGTIEEVGLYGAAQNLSIIPSLFGMSLSPLLLSTVSRQLAEGKIDEAKAFGRGAVRVILGLFPFGALVAGSASEIVAGIDLGRRCDGRRHPAAGSVCEHLVGRLRNRRQRDRDPRIRRARCSFGYEPVSVHSRRRRVVRHLFDLVRHSTARDAFSECGRQRAGLRGGRGLAGLWILIVAEVGGHRDRNSACLRAARRVYLGRACTGACVTEAGLAATGVVSDGFAVRSTLYFANTPTLSCTRWV
jgi:hypothetical protein